MEDPVVVTGASSHLGRHAVHFLIRHTTFPIVAVHSPRAPDDVSAPERVEHLRADLTAPFPDRLKDRLTRARRVLHFAWTRDGDEAHVSNANRTMIERALAALPDPARFWLVSSVSASPQALSVYGRTKYEATRLVQDRGGSVLLCGLVVERHPPAGAYRMLRRSVARFPLAFRAIRQEPPVCPLHLEDLGHAIARTCAVNLNPAVYRMFSDPIGFNTFLALLEASCPRRRAPLPFDTRLVTQAAALAHRSRLLPARLCEQVQTFLYKDVDYLLAHPSIPGVTFRPCDDVSYFS